MGYLSALAKVKNKEPKVNSKSYKKKEAERKKLLSKRLFCEKCKESKTTLYKIYGKRGKAHYYCANCK